MTRFKTKKEFKEGYGHVPNWDTPMNPAFGEPWNKGVGLGMDLPGVKGKWTVDKRHLTDKPLLPIGTKVAIPLTCEGKDYKDNRSLVREQANKKHQNYLFYNGVADNKHILNHVQDQSGDYFYAYEILEAYERYEKEQGIKVKEPYIFKVGDRVRGKEDKKIIGQLGTIVCINGAEITVEFDNNINGHKGEGDKYKDGHCWYVHSSLLDLSSERKPVTKDDYKVGTRVLCTNFEPKGLKGTIIGINNFYVVEFDQKFDGHDGYGKIKGKDGHCYCFSWDGSYDARKHLTIISDPKPIEKVEPKKLEKIKVWVGENNIDLLNKVEQKLSELGYKRGMSPRKTDSCFFILTADEIYSTFQSEKDFERYNKEYKIVTLKDLGIEDQKLTLTQQLEKEAQELKNPSKASVVINTTTNNSSISLQSYPPFGGEDRVIKINSEKVSIIDYKPQIQTNKQNDKIISSSEIVGKVNTVRKEPFKIVTGVSNGGIRVSGRTHPTTIGCGYTGNKKSSF